MAGARLARGHSGRCRPPPRCEAHSTAWLALAAGVSLEVGGQGPRPQHHRSRTRSSRRGGGGRAPRRRPRRSSPRSFRGHSAPRPVLPWCAARASAAGGRGSAAAASSARGRREVRAAGPTKERERAASL
eukprot:scaffold20011_cov33-Tisochrysis_lutea.AAC.9